MAMQLLGSRTGAIAGLSASAVSDTAFASLSSDGTVGLWDVRLKNRNYMSVPTNRGGRRGADGTELLLVADRSLVVALCDRYVRFVDVRRQMDVLSEYAHPTEVVSFVSGPHPAGRRTTLIIDEEGHVVPLDLLEMQPTAVVEDWVFGQSSVAAPTAQGFGELSNYCCGLGQLNVPASGTSLAGGAVGEEEEGRRWDPAAGSRLANTPHALLALGMDGSGCLYRGPERSLPVTISIERLAADGAPQLVNPPLPVCCGFSGERLAVGKADGTYEVLAMSADGCGLDELMAAPGHASNGLCCVQWTNEGRHLLTVSLCGQTTLWAVQDFLEDEEGELDMPEVLAAMDQRECVGSATAVVNGGAELCPGQFLLADSEGNVTLSTYA